jgi:transglutaminase-like cysteine proteinase BTLCP
MVERWSYPNDGYGDCEDYVLLKRRILIESGWGQVRELLDIFGWALPFDGCASRPTEASYSSSSSFLTAAICRRSNSVTLTERHRSAARMSAPNINFKTALSPNAFGMILSRRRSSDARANSWFESPVDVSPGSADGRCRLRSRR